MKFFSTNFFASHSPQRSLRFCRPRGGISLRAQAATIQSAAPLSTETRARAGPFARALGEALPLPEDRGAADLEQTIKRLGTTASVLFIVAHPDDEDGALMTYLSRGLGVRVTLLTLTRGEGGQNAMGAESYDALGLIRTNELLKADRILWRAATLGHRGRLRIFEDAGRSLFKMGPRSRAL